MGTVLGSSIISTASVLLLDTSNIRWSLAEMLVYLNDGQRELAIFKPTASVKTQTVTLAAGIKQSLPSDGLVLVDVVHNTNSNNSVRGRAVRIISRELLDAQTPDWPAAASTGEIRHFMYTNQDPRTYWVYPPAAAAPAQYLQIIYGSVPTPLPNADTVISVDDIWVPALLNYILFRAYSKDSEYAANAPAAAAYYQAFSQLVGASTTGEAATSPNLPAGVR